jgi:hypothetical protein
MPDLETLLRDVRPAPDPDWAVKLDARVAARFPAPVPRWKAKLHALRDHMAALTLTTATAAALVSIVVVGVNMDNSGDDEGSVAMTAEAPTSDSSGGAGGSNESDSDGSGSSGNSGSSTAPKQASGPQPSSAAAPLADAPASDRAVLRNAAITLSTPPDQVESMVDRAIALVDGLGGFVQTSEVSSSGSRASATLTVKIPSARLDSGLAQISKLAHVKSRSQQAQDVTDQRSSLEAAVRDARADRDGLRARLAKAATDKERSSLRARLDRASRRVTRAERQVAALGQEVAYATVELSVVGERRSGAAVPGDRWTPGDAIGDAGRVLEVVAGVLVIALAILVPLGILAVLAALGNRVITRRRRDRALETA